MGLKDIAISLGLQRASSALNFKVTRKFNNRKFKIPVINNIGFDNVFYEPDNFLIKLFKAIKLPGNLTFVDVGVNVGQSLLNFVSCHNNAYIGFEPNSNCNFYLNKLVYINKLNNVRILPIGLSSHNSIGKFYITKFIDSSATTVEGLRPGFYDENKSPVYIPLFAFDELGIDEIGKIGLVKIDVEGGELEVIKGMKKMINSDKPIIICEVLDFHSFDTSAKLQQRTNELCAEIKDAGYSIYRLHNLGNGKIDVELISEIVLVKWTEKSYNLNDYIFIPNGISPSEILKF